MLTAAEMNERTYKYHGINRSLGYALKQMDISIMKNSMVGHYKMSKAISEIVSYFPEWLQDESDLIVERIADRYISFGYAIEIRNGRMTVKWRYRDVQGVS